MKRASAPIESKLDGIMGDHFARFLGLVDD